MTLIVIIVGGVVIGLSNMRFDWEQPLVALVIAYFISAARLAEKLTSEHHEVMTDIVAKSLTSELSFSREKLEIPTVIAGLRDVMSSEVDRDVFNSLYIWDFDEVLDATLEEVRSQLWHECDLSR